MGTQFCAKVIHNNVLLSDVATTLTSLVGLPTSINGRTERFAFTSHARSACYRGSATGLDLEAAR